MAAIKFVLFAGIRNFPADLVGKLTNRSYHYFIVKAPTWKDGAPNRMRLRFDKAKGLAALVGYSVSYALDQTGPVKKPDADQAAFAGFGHVEKTDA